MNRPIDVIAYAGGRGEERPTAIRLRPRISHVTVLGAWVETGRRASGGVRRWFRVELEDARILTIYCDEALESWFYREDL